MPNATRIVASAIGVLTLATGIIAPSAVAAELFCDAYVTRHRLGDTPISVADTGTDSAAAGVWNGDVLEDWTHVNDYGSIAGHAQASADVGALACIAVMDYTDSVAGGTRESFQSKATAQYTEVVYIEAPEPEFWANYSGYTVELKYHISGQITRSGAIYTNAQLLAYNRNLNDGEIEGPGHEALYYIGNPDDGVFDEDVYYQIWDYTGEVFEIEISLETSASNTNLWDFATTGAATLDFFNTMTLESISVMDDNFDPVVTFNPDGSCQSGDPGFSFNRDIPEPATMALLALAGLSLCTRRRA